MDFYNRFRKLNEKEEKKPRSFYRIMEVFILEVNSKEISKVVSCYIGY